ncbi:LLM class flavin-dependent oxidoreductase [Kineococcus sp. SYSU DK005]|uniref:LLM class flavin-dependent oxidoreductase n=1 Tax=Kineococcus sp. SYSU DK005 TaxID=3383126 RepID=UPI003D7D7020
MAGKNPARTRPAAVRSATVSRRGEGCVVAQDTARPGTALDAVLWPDQPWPVLREQWSLAERWGLGRGWLWDHLVLDGRPLWHDAWTVLAAAAATTSTIGLGRRWSPLRTSATRSPRRRRPWPWTR